MSELTTRQWALYNYIKDREDWTTQENIATALGDFYNWYPQNYYYVLDDFHNSKARKDMTADIREINKSDVIQKMIIVSSKGVKIASEAEAERYIKQSRVYQSSVVLRG